jgi:hypothetical protein
MFGGDISIDLRGGMGDVTGVIHVYLNVPGLLLLPFLSAIQLMVDQLPFCGNDDTISYN